MITFIAAYLSVISAHVLTAALLAARRAQLPPYNETRSHSSRLLKLLAPCTALWTVYVAHTFEQPPTVDAGVRVAAFFYALKILDFGLHSNQPPTLLKQHAKPASMSSTHDRATYVWKLLSEFRYLSFDIAVRQPARSRAALSGDRQWLAPGNIVPAIIVIGLNVVFPTTEARALGVLLAIQWVFEVGHSFVHVGCPQPLFDRPFMAASMSSFWTSHWHAFASSTLRGLAYEPVTKIAGRAAGVMATFALSGAWHAFAVVNISDSRKLPWMVLGLFIVFGLVCGMERLIFGQKQGSLIQRVLVWGIAVFAAGQCYRELQCHSRIAALKGNCT